MWYLENTNILGSKSAKLNSVKYYQSNDNESTKDQVTKSRKYRSSQWKFYPI